MTLVTIDITGVASSTGPDDRVILRAPTIREKSGGGLVSTREEVVPLVDGVGDIELEPGPVMVKFLCEGISDTKEKLGVVPDTGPVNLAQVIEATFTWTPEQVNQALETIRGAVGVAVAGEMGQAVRQATIAAVSAEQSAVSADRRATSAETEVGAYTPRVEALEAMNGVSPESPVDGQTANLVGQPGTLTRGALEHAFGDRADPATHRIVYVTSDGSDSNSGGSWGDALGSISGAYAALGETGGTIEVGAGTFEVDGLPLKTRVRMVGRGIGSTTLQSPPRKTLFNVTSSVSQVTFEHIRFHPRSSHGFDCAIGKSISGSQWRSVEWWLEPDYSAINMPDGQWIENTISDFRIGHKINATVPAIKLWSSINAINVNTFENGQFLFSGSEPSIDIRSLGSTWVYDNIFRRINFEVTAGGAARVLGGMNTVFESCVVYDLQITSLNPSGELNDHCFYIGKSQSGLASQFTTFRNVARRGSTTGVLADGTKAFDIYLEPGGADTTMMEHCYAVGGHMNLAWNMNDGTYVGRIHTNTRPGDGSDNRVTYLDPVRGNRVFKVASIGPGSLSPEDTHLGATRLDPDTGIVYMAYGGEWKPINQLSEVEPVAPAGAIVGRVAVRGDGGVILGYVPVYGNSS